MDLAARPVPAAAPRSTEKSRREGLRGALGVVGVVGLLAVVGVLVTLGVVNGSDDDRGAGASVAVGSDDRGADVIDAFGGTSAPSASASADRPGRKPGASKNAKDPASAAPSGSTSAMASAAPGTDGTADPEDDTQPRSATSAAVPGVSIFSHDSDRCIDIVGGAAVPGAKLMIWDCSESPTQQWTFTGGTMRALGLCVRTAGGSTDDGVDLELGSCDGSAAQRFTLNTSHDLVNTPTGKCADVRDHQKTNGSRLQLWSCTGLDNQKWSTR
jgi:hypothetical protein